MQCIFVDGKRFHFRGFHFGMQFRRQSLKAIVFTFAAISP